MLSRAGKRRGRGRKLHQRGLHVRAVFASTLRPCWRGGGPTRNAVPRWIQEETNGMVNVPLDCRTQISSGYLNVHQTVDLRVGVLFRLSYRAWMYTASSPTR